MSFIEASALDSNNVDLAFENVLTGICFKKLYLSVLIKKKFLSNRCIQNIKQYSTTAATTKWYRPEKKAEQWRSKFNKTSY